MKTIAETDAEARETRAAGLVMRTMNAHNLDIAALCPKDESRFTLNGIHITPEYTEMTDGHLLMRVAKPEITIDQFPMVPGLELANQGSAILGAAECAAISKALPARSNIPVLATAALCSNGAVDENGKPVRYVVATDLETVVKKPVMTTGTYPDTDRVIPKSDGMAFAIAFDATLMAKLMTQFVRMNKGRNKGNPVGVTMYFGEPTVKDGKAMLPACLMTGTTDANQNVTAVLMPVRAGAEVDEFWTAKRRREREAAEAADTAPTARPKEEEGVTYWVCRNPECGSEFTMDVKYCSHCFNTREDCQRIWPKEA